MPKFNLDAAMTAAATRDGSSLAKLTSCTHNEYI
jgi:hypothetical protein